MSKKINVSHKWEIDLWGFKIPCYVLEDWTRVLSARWMQEALKMVDEKEDWKQLSGTRLNRYLWQKSLQRFIYKEKWEDHFQPIECYLWDSKINWYEATVLIDICDAFLEARKHISLSTRQEIISEQCEILVRSFAKIGLIALIDEATWYQKQKDEYQKTFALYIAEEMRPWVKTFKDEYYEELYRLLDWDWEKFVSWKKNHPQVIWKITNELIYYKLPRGILDKLQEINPKDLKGNRKNKHFQFLTENIWYRELIELIWQIIFLAKMYKRWEYKKFKAHFDSMKPDQREWSQMSLIMPFSIEEYIWNQDKDEPIKQEELSDLNQKLKKWLEYNPKDSE